MGRTLVIAEKPSVGQDLARVLPGPFEKHGREWLDQRLAEYDAADAARTDVAEEMLHMFVEQNDTDQPGGRP